MMKSGFYLMFKAFLVLKIFKILSRFFYFTGKRFNKKAKVNFKIYDVTGWITNNYNTHCPICQEVKSNIQ